MKPNIKNLLKINMAVILSVVFGFFFHIILVKAQTLPNSSDGPNFQRTIIEVDANGLPAPIMPLQSNAVTYLIMSALFAGIALFSIYIYRKSPSKTEPKKIDNENKKL